MIFKQLKISLLALVVLFTLNACVQTTQTQPEQAAQPNNVERITEIYEAHEDGRIYAFYDRALYKEFLQVGETPFRLTRIGTGPNGKTMVFGLTAADKKKGENTPAVKLYENKVKPADNFYAEMTQHGRIYVFDKFADMDAVRQFGHPTFFYTEIGSGPSGETVVYVLNKGNNKHKPEALIAEFKKRNK
jgi:hypothetical protein